MVQNCSAWDSRSKGQMLNYGFEEVRLGGFASVFLLGKMEGEGIVSGKRAMSDKVGTSPRFQQSPKPSQLLFYRELSRLPDPP